MEVRHNQVSLAALYTSNVLVDRGHQKGPTLSHCKTQTKPSLVGISQCVIKRRCKKNATFTVKLIMRVLNHFTQESYGSKVSIGTLRF